MTGPRALDPIAVALLLALLACGSLAMGGAVWWQITDAASLERAAAASLPTSAPASPTARSAGVATPTSRTATVREMWAVAATASSEFTRPEFAAIQAAGQPDTPRCGDQPTAWASGKRAAQEWIELTYPSPVYATRVVVVQSHNPGNVVQIDLRDNAGQYRTIFRGRDPTRDCPGRFSPSFEPTTYLVTAVRVYVQDPPNDWAEIDAVQLVGSLTPP